MVITEFPKSRFSKLQREIRYTIGKVLFIFRVFEDKIVKIVYENGKEPLEFQMHNSQSSWVRIYERV